LFQEGYFFGGISGNGAAGILGNGEQALAMKGENGKFMWVIIAHMFWLGGWGGAMNEGSAVDT